MRISGSGMARNGMNAIKRRTELYMAKAAISALHDALLAVAQGKITPDQVRDFFWHGEAIEDAEYFGDVLDLSEETTPPADPPPDRDDDAGLMTEDQYRAAHRASGISNPWKR